MTAIILHHELLLWGEKQRQGLLHMHRLDVVKGGYKVHYWVEDVLNGRHCERQEQAGNMPRVNTQLATDRIRSDPPHQSIAPITRPAPKPKPEPPPLPKPRPESNTEQERPIEDMLANILAKSQQFRRNRELERRFGR